MIRPLTAALRRALLPQSLRPSLPPRPPQAAWLATGAAGLQKEPSSCRRVFSSTQGFQGMAQEQEGKVRAQIVGLHQETPTAKRIVLRPETGPQGQQLLSFLPGQWVDFFVPGLSSVGGFSFTSTPRQLACDGTFELAVKRSSHAPAAWLHDRAKVGDLVAVRVGGQFTYLPGDERRPLLLVAGGIGINPLYSILRHCWELLEAPADGAGGSCSMQGICLEASTEGSGNSSGSGGEQEDGSSASGNGTCPAGRGQQPGPSTTAEEAAGWAAAACAGPGRRQGRLHAAVLYSASVPAELAFRRELEQLQAQAGGTVRLQLHATAPEWRGRDAEWGGRWGRIGWAELQAALKWLQGGPEDRCRATGAASAAAGAGAAAAPASRAGSMAACSEQAGDGSCSKQGSGSGGSGGGSSGQGQGQGRGASRYSRVTALVCGPAGMEDAVVAQLLSLGLHADQIRFEKWW